MMRVRVECYAGYRGEETPRLFWLGAKKIEVQDVLDRWMAPDHRYFKVLGHDKAVYILRHDAVSWDWDLTFYQQAGTPIDPAAS
jgi:hypothetical protein